MRDPDITGSTARAWESRIEITKDEDAAHIGAWFVTGPFHPAWSWWVVTAVSLEELPGVPPPHRKFPEASFEIMIVSLNPDFCPPDLDAAPLGGGHYLEPLDLVWQGTDLDRDQVRRVLRKMVEEITAGRLSPDSDFRRAWEELLPQYVEHVRFHAD